MTKSKIRRLIEQENDPELIKEMIRRFPDPEMQKYARKVRKEEAYGDVLDTLERNRSESRLRFLRSLDKRLGVGGTNKVLRKLVVLVAKHKSTR